MNYMTLYNEIIQPSYAGMTDAEIAGALNTPGAAARRRVPIAELQARAMEVSVYVALRTAVADPAVPGQLRAVCQTVLDLANARFADVDLDNPASVQMFGTLQQAGIITLDQAAAIDALADVPGVSRAAALGLGAVSEADIQAARDWHAAQVAEAARQTAFVALRETLQTAHAHALARLIQMQATGDAAPAWSDVLDWMA